MAEEGVPPVEIPWRLLNTTLRHHGANPPRRSSISIFAYKPRLESFATDYPAHHLIYFKISVSLRGEIESTRPLLEGDRPIWSSELTLGVVEPATAGSFEPYFAAAAPSRRTMIETGVIGTDAYEGEASATFVGKSGAQLHESMHTHMSTTSGGGGVEFRLGPFSIGGGVSATGTDVTGRRDVLQQSDTTTRQASEERRDLLSHSTNVANVLSLLHTVHVGTPYLRFTLSPTPVKKLAIDPTDPFLWYAELNKRRSVGLTGVQDFYAIAVVPATAKEICLTASLRNVYVIDEPPAPPDGIVPASPDINSGAIANVLSELYPPGTSIDELDVDLVGQPAFPYPLSELIAPVVRNWIPLPDVAAALPPQSFVGVVVEGMTSAMAPWGALRTTIVAYKTGTQAFLDTSAAVYLADLARSPLERGRVASTKHELETCVSGLDGTDALIATTPAGMFTPAVVVGFGPGQDTMMLSDLNATVARWGDLDRVFQAQLDSWDWEKPLSESDPRFVSFALRQLARGPDAAESEQAWTELGISALAAQALSRLGVTNVPTLAAALRRSALDTLVEQRELLLPEGDEEARGVAEKFSAGLAELNLNTLRRALAASLDATARDDSPTEEFYSVPTPSGAASESESEGR